MKKRTVRKSLTSLAEMPASPLDALVKKLDMVVVEMETKWGSGCLPTLCTPETAAKFMRAHHRLNEAIRGMDYDTVKAAAENLTKGWLKMDSEAMEINKPIGQIWYVSSPSGNGVEYVICQSELDSARFVQNNPHRASSVFTLADIAKKIDDGSVGLKTNLEPKHQNILSDSYKKLSDILDDEIPW